MFGAGPVGLMGAYFDRVSERLQNAKEIGCVLDFSNGDPVELIKALRDGQVFLELNVGRRCNSPQERS